ncbi:PKD domain-containing protein [Chitinophaga niabensis]|uniref:Alpha/beta hydrolase family protein n=1 Tax=Chitinophaga niabensis TaxID=536979 RepID=A0A1N6EEU9_9BACT|nr:PKD domain-containing protein [Chitinophaga niabensis]SIN81540.1 Alpha/beta hydrolase family protein [Chitinophaga niabensis]
MKKFYQVRGWCVRYLFYLSFISLSLQVKAQQVPKTFPAGAPVRNMTGYYESLPADYASTTKKYPVLIFVHGVGELAGADLKNPLSAVLANGPAKLINQGKFPASFTVNGQTHSFIVISPQFITWPGGNDVHELLAYLKTIYRIDESRCYVTGLSMGGGVTWGVISENTDKAKLFAAAVVVCGAWNPNDAPRTPSLQWNIASINMPVFATHNDRDPTVPLKYSQDWVNGINAIIPAPNPKALLTVFSSTSHDAWSKTYDPAYKDPQTGLNVYEWMLQYTRGTVVQPPPPPPPPPPGNKKITVNPSSANIIYYDNAMSQLGVTAGDTLCIPPGDYEYIHFGKLLGTADKPIVITNCGGLVRAGVNSSATAASFVLSTCKYFKVEGTGAAGIEYGFDINGTNKNGVKMFGMFFGNGTSDFDVHHAYIHDAGMFLQAKTLQQCSHPEWLDGSFTMKNVKIHDLMCRNSAWEGFYIGNTHYLYTEGSCVDMKSHLIENLSVYNNNLENMGSDGIQISTAYNGDNRVYNNRVVNYAMARNSAHGYGILSGGGSSLRIYSNYVSKGYNSGIEIFGSGINQVYNNVVTDIHYEGINVSDKPLFDPATAYIYNNTVYNTGVNGIKVYGYETLLGHKIYNNVVIAPGTQWDDPMTGYYVKGAKPILYDFKNNVNYKTPDLGGFVNPLAGDFRLKAGSTAIDAGRNMADLGLTNDFDGNARPVNNSFDAGAFEFNGSSAAVLPVANAGADKLLVPADNKTTVLDGSASSKEGGTIASYAWKKLSGPAATIATPNGATTQLSGLAIGSYVFELTVTDNAGLSAKDQVTVTVLAAANKPPVSDAGSNVTLVLPSNSTQLTGSFSLDPDGVIVSYEWKRVSGPAAGTIDDITASNAIVSGLAEGVYVYELTVTDNGGLTNSKQVTVTVQGVGANKPPVANAGADVSITLPTTTAQLDGSASADPDGTITSYTWTKISGPAAGVITTSNANKTSITGLTIAGDYVYELSVKDNGGTSATDQVKVTVLPSANKLPVANAGTNVTITLPTSTAQLDGSASSDPDGTISTYSWVKISGPAAGAISTANVSKTAVTGLTIAGDYLYELTVTDNNGGKATAQVKVTVTDAPANKPPVANAGADVTVILPASTAQLDGSASSDPDGTITNYTWTKISGPAGGAITTANANKTTITGLTIAGEYVYELSVKDNGGTTVTDQVKVVVITGGSNQPPVAKAGFNTTITLPVNSVELDGSASSDPDGSIAAYSWKKLGGPASGTITTANAAKTTVTGYTLDGTYVYELTVTDNQGLSTSSNVTITVKAAANQKPISNAGVDITITLPVNTVQLDGSASSDPDGTITYYNWTKISGPAVGNIGSPSASRTTVTGLTLAGDYLFQLEVKDDAGARETDYVKITVLPGVNKLPVANAGGDISITLPTNTAQLDGSASSDADGTITTYAWTKVSGPAGGAITTANASKTTLTGLTIAGEYVYQLSVTDNAGASATDQVKVVVVAGGANRPPVARAGFNTTITLPVNSVQLDGSASSDPDGSIASYSWRKLGGPAGGNITVTSASRTTVTGYTLEGVYVYELTVTDNQGLSASSNVTITVNPEVINKPPVAQTSGDVNITLPVTTATLDGSPSVDLDGSIVSYAWKQLSGPVTGTIAAPSAARTDITNLTAAGQYIFELTVKDNGNATSSVQVKVVVNTPANKLPTARVNGNLTIILPVTGTSLDGSSSTDEDGTIISYSWKKISGASGSIGSPNAMSTAITDLTTEGQYVFELTVTDNANATATARVTISVLPAQTPENKPPVALTQGNLEITLPDNSVQVNGSTSYDSDGTISTYEWIQLTGPNNSLIWDAQKAQTNITGLIKGEYVFQLAVTDNKGAKTNTSFNVRVLDNSNGAKGDTASLTPNPVSTFARLNIQRKGSYKVNIEIYDISGKLWKQFSTNFIDRLQEDIQLSELPNGHYILNVAGPNFKKWTEKFVKIGH